MQNFSSLSFCPSGTITQRFETFFRWGADLLLIGAPGLELGLVLGLELGLELRLPGLEVELQSAIQMFFIVSRSNNVLCGQ